MTKERASAQLIWCLFWIYTINILGKTSFSAATVALINEGMLSKTQAGLISGVFWMLYAVGQVIGGFAVNKMPAYVMLKTAIVVSTIANLLMAFQNEFIPMLIIWSINGILQFGMWPAVLKLISEEIIAKQKSGAMNRLAFCYCLGSILSYFLTSVILEVLSWKYVFIGSGMMTGISWLVSIYAGQKLSPILQEKEVRAEIVVRKKEKLTWNIVWRSELICFCMLIAIKGIVDNGIKNWMPTIMMETFGAAPSYTSILSVGLLVTNILGVVLCKKIYEKVKCDELLVLRILYAMTTPMMLMLLNFENMNIYISTVLMSGVTILVYGSGQILAMNYPGRFLNWGLTATVGGIINGFAAFGNVIATYGSGYIADHFGWNVMIMIWNVLILLFVALTILMMPMWKKFRWKK